MPVMRAYGGLRPTWSRYENAQHAVSERNDTSLLDPDISLVWSGRSLAVTDGFYIVARTGDGRVLLGKNTTLKPTYGGGGEGVPARVEWSIPVEYTNANKLIRVTVWYDPRGDRSMLLPEQGYTFTLQYGETTPSVLPIDYLEEAG